MRKQEKFNLQSRLRHTGADRSLLNFMQEGGTLRVQNPWISVHDTKK